MRPISLALSLVLAAALAGCTTDSTAVGSILSRPRAVTAVSVDGRTAAAQISGYRATHGLPPVSVDQRLTRIAADHARRMAAADRLAHALPGEGSFARRLSAGGFDAAIAAENIGAGYKSLAAAMAGWQGSAAHDRNLLRPGVSLIGIAAFTAPDGKYKTYWSLVLAEPHTARFGARSAFR